MNFRKISLLTGILFFTITLFGQKGIIRGVITDKVSGERLIGANVTYAPGKGVVTNIDGEYEMELAYGDYTLNVSYVGFEPITKDIKLNQAQISINFQMKYQTLTEVEVVGDMAKTRETPVAFSNIESIKLEEELASQDIPLILNATPGVYATQQGGGDGDSRINIRGFNQRNVAVMLDGIPVNDMENGWVYWSNWFGLDVVMQKTQVQRGLGKSKLAIPSVGGTINLQTKGIGARPKYTIKQEMGTDWFMRTSFGLTTGKLKNGWGITAAGSYKRGDGWVDQTWTEGWFYFLRVDKELGNHRLSFKAMGAPQQHGQRSYKSSIAQYDTSYALDHGISREDFLKVPLNLGLKYNPNWGWLERYKLDENGNKIARLKQPLNEKKNYYYKPMFSLSDFWNVNENLYVSNILYLSVGTGGGTGLANSSNITSNGLIDFQSLYDANYNGRFNPNKESTGFLYTSRNDHFWYGLLSTFSLNLNEFWTLSGGLDIRHYKGEHFREVYDLLGGNYIKEESPNPNEPKAAVAKRGVGDIINYHNDGIVNWGGVFAQLEYSRDKWTAFLNVTGSYSGYKRIDYFKFTDENIAAINASDSLRKFYEQRCKDIGADFNSAMNGQETDWKWIAGGTAKGGVNYNINDNMNVFANLGYLSKAPRFNNVYDYNNQLYREIKNENVKAAELGYSYYNSKITFNFNSYYTLWENKPADYAPVIMIDDEPYRVNINGMDARHMGLEFEFAYQITDKIKLESLLSVGDWQWTSSDSARIYDDNLNLKEVRYFDAKGIYVGDAAQLQNRESIRVEPFKDFYFIGSFTYFGNHYSNFDPLNLDPERNPTAFDENGNPRQSWKIPDYYIFDLHAGYTFRTKDLQFHLRGSVLNLLDEMYISDADNNDSYTGQGWNNFDARSAAVFFGLGRRFNISLQMEF